MARDGKSIKLQIGGDGQHGPKTQGINALDPVLIARTPLGARVESTFTNNNTRTVCLSCMNFSILRDPLLVQFSSAEVHSWFMDCVAPRRSP